MHYLNQHYNRPFDPDLVKYRSVSRACREFKVNTVNASTRAKLAMDLYRQLCELGLFKYQYNQQLEIEFPILDKKIESTILNFLNLQLSDNQHAFILDSSGKYHLTRPNNDPVVNSQEILIQDAIDRQKKLRSQQHQGKTRLVSRTKRKPRLLGNLWQALRAWYPFK